MFLTLLAPQAVPATQSEDTSDVLVRNLRRKGYDIVSPEEEAMVAQILKNRSAKKRHFEIVKKAIDWKKLFTDKINGVDTLEELNAIPIPTIKTESIEVTQAILNEIKQAKEQRRLELEIAKREAEIKLLELQTRTKTKIKEQQKAIKAAKELQLQVLERYQLAVQEAIKLQEKALQDAIAAEQEAKEFAKKRNQRLNRLRSLLWLAGLDI